MGGKFTCGKWLLESWLCLEFISAVLAPGHFLRIAVVNISELEVPAMAPHSSTLAWKIPWTEEPGRLQSMGSLGVGHD